MAETARTFNVHGYRNCLVVKTPTVMIVVFEDEHCNYGEGIISLLNNLEKDFLLYVKLLIQPKAPKEVRSEHQLY